MTVYETFNIILTLTNAKKKGSEYIGSCPFCETSTSGGHHFYTSMKKGNIVMFCHKCNAKFEDFCDMFGIKKSDCFQNNDTVHTTEKREHIYHDTTGKAIAKKVIYKKQDGKKECKWYRFDGNRYVMGLNGLKPPIYDVHKLIKSDTVYIAEGEKDAETLQKIGYSATTSPNGAGSKWNTENNKYLTQKNIVIVHDNDSAGIKYAENVAKSIIDDVASLKIINPTKILPNLKNKGDISDVVKILGAENTKSRLDEITAHTSNYSIEENNSSAYNKKADFTPNLLQEYLNENGISVKYNDITRSVDITGMNAENQEHLQSNIIPLIYSKLQNVYKRCNMQTVQAYLNIISSRNNYNPVLEHLNRYEWDGKDRLQAVYDILGISDELSKTLIKKWLWQCISLLHNDISAPWGADGVLVLTGSQGIGKTSFFRHISMLPQFFKEGVCIDFRDKDSYIRALSCWIAELGEIETTLKSDIERLKAFISQRFDEYRLPYGRADIKACRRTSFCGSCNSEQFLIDETGNRRFWTVKVDNIDLKKLQNLNAIQLWKQVQNFAECDLQGFRLTHTEQQILAQRNANHEKPLKGEDEIRDIFERISMCDSNKVIQKAMTVSDFKDLHIGVLGKYSANQIGKVLDRLGYTTEIMKQNGKTSRIRVLPYKI